MKMKDLTRAVILIFITVLSVCLFIACVEMKESEDDMSTTDAQIATDENTETELEATETEIKPEIIAMPILTEEEIDMIIGVYASDYERREGTKPSEAYLKNKRENFECYLKCGDVYAVKAGVHSFQGTKASDRLLERLWFEYPDMERMKIIKNGIVYSLEGAYLNGIIDDGLSEELYAIYRPLYEHLYVDK